MIKNLVRYGQVDNLNDFKAEVYVKLNDSDCLVCEIEYSPKTKDLVVTNQVEYSPVVLNCFVDEKNYLFLRWLNQPEHSKIKEYK